MPSSDDGRTEVHHSLHHMRDGEVMAGLVEVGLDGAYAPMSDAPPGYSGVVGGPVMPDPDRGRVFAPPKRSAPLFGARGADAGPELQRPEPSLRHVAGPADHEVLNDSSEKTEAELPGPSHPCNMQHSPATDELPAQAYYQTTKHTGSMTGRMGGGYVTGNIGFPGAGVELTNLLVVSDLERSVGFYRETLAAHLRWHLCGAVVPGCVAVAGYRRRPDPGQTDGDVRPASRSGHRESRADHSGSGLPSGVPGAG
jgi:hypothetical protein